ncbi:hypothetical protein [Streptomyces sp. NPDC096132]
MSEIQRSQQSTHTYGSGGCPPRQWCMAPAPARYGKGLRYVSTRQL